MLIEIVSKKLFLAFLNFVKQVCKQTTKYLKTGNIIDISDIGFLINKFVVFINKDADSKLTQYIASKQK